MTEQQELGVLRSNITLTLHSQYATRLWQGRPLIREGKKVVQAQILSMPSCLSILSQIQRDSANDDPYDKSAIPGFPNIFKTLDQSPLGKASTELHGKPNSYREEQPSKPYFTIAPNSTLIGSIAMTALIGRVPVNGSLYDTYSSILCVIDLNRHWIYLP